MKRVCDGNCCQLAKGCRKAMPLNQAREERKKQIVLFAETMPCFLRDKGANDDS